MTFFGATSIGFETLNPYLTSEDYMKIILTNNWDNDDNGASIVDDILAQTDITRSIYTYPVLAVKYTILFVQELAGKIVAAQQFYVTINCTEGNPPPFGVNDVESLTQGLSWEGNADPAAGSTIRLYLINAGFIWDMGG